MESSMGQIYMMIDSLSNLMSLSDEQSREFESILYTLESIKKNDILENPEIMDDRIIGRLNMLLKSFILIVDRNRETIKEMNRIL